MYRDHFDRAGKPSCRTAQPTGQKRQPAYVKPGHLCGATVAAQHRHRKARDRVAQQNVQRTDDRHAHHQPPMHRPAGNVAQSVKFGHRYALRLDRHVEIPDRASHEVQQDRRRDVIHQKGRNRLVHAAPVLQCPCGHDPRCAEHGTGQTAGHHAKPPRQACQHHAGQHSADTAQRQRAFAADHQHAHPGRDQRTKRGQDDGRGQRQRVLDGKRRAERAQPERGIDGERIKPLHRDEDPEDREGHDQCQRRQHEGLKPRAATQQRLGDRPVSPVDFVRQPTFLVRGVRHQRPVSPDTPSTSQFTDSLKAASSFSAFSPAARI